MGGYTDDISAPALPSSSGNDRRSEAVKADSVGILALLTEAPLEPHDAAVFPLQYEGVLDATWV